MPATILPGKWLHHFRQEYLDSFISDGGATVKFVVPLDDISRDEVTRGIVQSARASQYLYVSLDAATTKIHLAQHIFFKGAEQVPWREISQRVVRSMLTGEGFSVPKDGTGPLAQRTAEANQANVDYVLMTLRRAIGNGIIKRSDLAKDFRVAMTWLCRSELSGGPDGESAIEAITNWLTGRSTHIHRGEAIFNLLRN